jgi:hypothetical protein
MDLPRFINKEVGVLADAYHHDEICGPGQSLTVPHWNYYYQTKGREEFLKMIKRCIAARMRAFDKAPVARMTYLKNVINSTPSPTQVQIDGVDYALPSFTVTPFIHNDYISDLDHLQFIYLLRRLYLLVLYRVTNGQVCEFTLNEPIDRGQTLVNTLATYGPDIDMTQWQWNVHRELSLYFNSRFATVQVQGLPPVHTGFHIYDPDSVDHVVASIGDHIIRRCEIVYEDPEDVYTGPFGILDSVTVDRLNVRTGSSHLMAYFWSSFMSLRFGMFTNDTWEHMLQNITLSGIPPRNQTNPCFTKGVDETHIITGHTLPPYVREPLVDQLRSRVCNYIMVKMLRKLEIALQRISRFVATILDLFQKDESGQLPLGLDLLPLIPIFEKVDKISKLEEILKTLSAGLNVGAGAGAGAGGRRCSGTGVGAGAGAAVTRPYILNVRYEYFVSPTAEYKTDLQQIIMEHLSFDDTIGVPPEEIRTGKPSRQTFEPLFRSLIVDRNKSGLTGACPSDLIEAQLDKILVFLSKIDRAQQDTINLCGTRSFQTKHGLTPNVFLTSDPNNPDPAYEGTLWSRNRQGGVTDLTIPVIRKNMLSARLIFQKVFKLILSDTKDDPWIPYSGYVFSF